MNDEREQHEHDDERAQHEHDERRRRFLLRVMGGAGAAAVVGLLTPPVSLLLSPLRHQDDDVWRTVGRVGEFPVGETVKVRILDPEPYPWAGFAAHNAVHLRRQAPQSFLALSAYCTHVGCPVRWAPGAEMFLCPCHGGAFFEDGTVAAGPPPRPLERHPVRLKGELVQISTRRRPSRRNGRA